MTPAIVETYPELIDYLRTQERCVDITSNRIAYHWCGWLNAYTLPGRNDNFPTPDHRASRGYPEAELIPFHDALGEQAEVNPTIPVLNFHEASITAGEQ